MTKDEMLAVMKEAIDEVVDDVPVDLGPDSGLGTSGIDSLSLVEIVLVMEERLGIGTGPDDFDDVRTVGDAVDVFVGLVDAQEAAEAVS
jgi:acyl carrier protein